MLDLQDTDYLCISSYLFGSLAFLELLLFFLTKAYLLLMK